MAKEIWNKDVESEIVDILKNLIKIKTINSHNNEIEAVNYIKKILDKEGIESTVIQSDKGRGNIIAKLKGGNKTPIIFLSHLDVVDVETDKWTFDPFEGTIHNEIMYGRGTLDTKHLTAMGLMIMLLLKRNNIYLNRDIIFAATADEENGSKYGMKYLMDNYPNLLPKGYVVNEGGGFVMEVDGKQFRTCACGEKGVCEVKIRIESNDEEDIYNTQNHTIIKLSKIIKRVTSYESELVMCEVSNKFKEAANSYISKDETLKNLWEYMTHNTMTVNKFNIEKKLEDLTKPIEVVINFRFLPILTKQNVIAIIEEILEGLDVTWEIANFIDGYESNIHNDFIGLLESKSNKFSEKTSMLPMVALGNTDGRFIRHNVYGYSPLLNDIPFSQVLKKVHSHDECITVNSLIYGTRVLFESVMEMLENN